MWHRFWKWTVGRSWNGVEEIVHESQKSFKQSVSGSLKGLEEAVSKAFKEKEENIIET